MWTPDICVYHFPCDDGFASAWVARRKWPDIQLVPTNYGLALPSDLDVSGKNVLIADFSFKYDELSAMSWKAKRVVILDHHKTAAADLDRLPRFNGGLESKSFECAIHQCWTENGPEIVACFDMEHSGAALTWEFCFPNEPMPEFIRFIEDRDLWRFSLKNTRPFSLYLKSMPATFEAWDECASEWQHEPETVMAKAYAIERFYDQRITEVVPTATLKTIGKWKDVPTAHAPYAFASDLAHELLKAHPSAPFAAVVVDAYGGRTYSLRSEDSRQDVSEVAKTFGGGGHRNAAGFRVPV